MREIKFRAWFKGNEDLKPMMCDVVAISKTSDQYDTFTLDSQELTAYGGRLAVPVYRINTEENTCEIMEFTGLHDKNGKEIYEGDIVIKHGTDYDSNTWRGEKRVVVYDNGSWYPVAHCYFDVRLIEVVGNIYENPELL